MSNDSDSDDQPPKVLGVIAYADAEAVFYTGKASDIARALALTAIAVVWFFAGGGIEHITPVATIHQLQLNTPLTWALYTAILSVILDLLQYLWGAAAWMLTRWSIQEALLRDVARTPSLTSAMIWRFGALVGVPRLLAEIASLSWPEEKRWVDRRDDLRKKIKDSREAGTLNATFGPTEGLQSLNAPIALMFWAKCALVIASYVLLALAVH
jgi:hypothetical protein